MTQIHPTIGLECFACATPHDPTALQTVCEECGLPLRVGIALPQGDPAQLIDDSVLSMWRYSAFLPLPRESAISLGEGWTPLVDHGDGVFIKDESVNPTGSFKARGLSMAVSAAVALGAERLVAPSAGNAASALAAYGQKAGLAVTVAMPEDTPHTIVGACRDAGADVHLIAGDIATAGRWLHTNKQPGDFDVSTLKEPFRVEGKKTMGYELWEQFGGDLPEVVVYPTGGGTGLVGMWKAWDEMEAMGWVGPGRPRLVSVQPEGCAPIARAFDQGRESTEPWVDPVTTAWGLRVPSPIGGFLCLRAVRETGGLAIGVPEAEIHRAVASAGSITGIDFCPEGGAAWAAMIRLRNSGLIGRHERVLVWNTGAGSNYR